jgi:hypothetical protein
MNERVLEFSIFFIESLAEKLNISARKVYNLLTKDTDLLDSYIIPCYEPLHTQSKNYIINELLEVLKENGIIAAPKEK